MSLPASGSANTERKPGARLEDRVYSGLLDDIRLGRFKLGQRLPSEAELAGSYGCSRPVIRSALAKLRESGLVVSRQGAGSFVSSGHADPASGFGALESIDDIAGYFRFRRLIESEAAEQAARRAGPDDIEQLSGLIETMEQQAEQGLSSVEADIEFHQCIAKLSDNRFQYETVVMLRPHWLFIGRFVRSLGKTGYRVGKRDMNAEHRAILAALRAGDGKAARAAMLTHIVGSERRVFKGE